VTFERVVNDIAIFEIFMPNTSKLDDPCQLTRLGTPDRKDFIFARSNTLDPTIKISLGLW
jgi:hypothetical protein